MIHNYTQTIKNTVVKKCHTAICEAIYQATLPTTPSIELMVNRMRPLRWITAQFALDTRLMSGDFDER